MKVVGESAFENKPLRVSVFSLSSFRGRYEQGWKLKPKPKPENPVLKEIFETQTETDTYLAKILKT